MKSDPRPAGFMAGRRKRDTFLPWLLLAVDCAAIYVLLRFTFWFRFTSRLFESSLGGPDYLFYFRAFNLNLVVLVFFLRFYGLYRPLKILTFTAETAKVFKAVAASVIILMALTFFIRGFTFSRSFLTISGLVLAVGLSLARWLAGLLVMWVDRSRGSLRNILIIGCDENAKKLVQFYKKNPRLSTRVMGFLDNRLEEKSLIEGVPVLGKSQHLSEWLSQNRDVHEVVLAEQGVPNDTVLKIIYECEKQLVTFRWITDIFGLIASRMNVTHLGGVPLLSFTDSPLADWENQCLKRAMDIAVSLGALIFFSPVLLLIAICVKQDSKGPVFYKQERIGEDGRRFMLIKFRTMKVGAETETGPVWANPDDPRRTRLGVFLRKNNLDELPQVWNVLAGDMSLVGPRPERPFFVSQFKEEIPRYMARHTIRSGITGWAQVNGLRGNTSIEERTKYDLYYIENWSLFLDIKILLMTFFARSNAY